MRQSEGNVDNTVGERERDSALEWIRQAGRKEGEGWAAAVIDGTPPRFVVSRREGEIAEEQISIIRGREGEDFGEHSRLNIL